MENIKRILEEQIGDPGLWFINPRTAPEAYLQAALRRLHAAIELDLFDSKAAYDKLLVGGDKPC